MLTFNLTELSRPKAIIQTESLLCDIEKALLSFSLKRRDQIRFAFKSIGEEDYYNFLQLQLMRKILINKTCGDNCLDCITIDEVVSLTTSLLYKFCK